MIYDAHTHLNAPQLFKNWKEYIAHFVERGGRALINVGADAEYNANALLIAQESQDLFSSCFVGTVLGYHPYETVKMKGNQISSAQDIADCKLQLLDYYSNYSEFLVAVGETGIDLHYPGSKEAISIQQQLFAMHCDLAKEFQLPLVIHSRDAFDQTLEVLEEYPGLKLYFHCRGYGADEVKRVLRVYPDVCIGYTGTVTYKNAENIRQSLAVTPRQCLLLETDAPYLAAQVVRGQTNEPAFVEYIYDFVAERLHMDREELDLLVKENFERFYHSM